MPIYMRKASCSCVSIGLFVENYKRNYGLILVTGPAGSGKTTTAYSLLRELVRRAGDGLSIMTLEDPIEVALNGIAQSQVNSAAEFDFPTGLRSLILRDAGISDDGLSKLTTISNLGRLDLRNVAITDAALPHLSQFTGLKELDVSGTGITVDGLTELKKALPQAKITY